MFEWIDDISLLDDVQAGNVQAFNHCYSKYRINLTVYAISILENETEAQDLVQEFFIDFWERKLYANVNTSLKSFLFVSIKNRCLDKLRRNDTRKRRLKEIQVKEDYVYPDHRMEDLELQQELSTTIEKVAPVSSKVFELAYFQGMSRNEIARVMGVSPHTVRNQLIRALKILRKHFSRNFDKDSSIAVKNAS